MAENWLPELDGPLGARRVAQGFEVLNQHFKTIQGMRALEPGVCSVAVRLAEWVDLGYRAAGTLKGLVNLFSPETRAGLRTQEFLELRMAEGFCAMDEEDLDRAIALLDFVLRAEAEFGERRAAGGWRASRISGRDGRTARRASTTRPCGTCGGGGRSCRRCPSTGWRRSSRSRRAGCCSRKERRRRRGESWMKRIRTWRTPTTTYRWATSSRRGDAWSSRQGGMRRRWRTSTMRWSYTEGATRIIATWRGRW